MNAVKALLNQALRRLETSKREVEAGSPAYALRSAQECVELCLKAALRLVGVEYPKRHDVSSILQVGTDRFPEWFNAGKYAEMSRWLFERRELAMYGEEALNTGPDQLFGSEEAEKALSFAREVYEACCKLLKTISRHED